MQKAPQAHMPHSGAQRPASERLAYRLAHILALLHQGDTLDKHQLAAQFNVDVRTIERDLHERMHGLIERGANGHWQLRPHLRSTVAAQMLNEYAAMAGTSALFPDYSLAQVIAQLQTPAAQRPLHVQPTAQEALPRGDRRFAQLQQAIEQHCECLFTYKNTPRRAQPYRLVHKNGIWYLAAVEGGRLKNFSIARIEALQLDEAARFAPQQKHLDYIHHKRDVWFSPETTEVTLRVAPEVAHYFMRRELLPEQQHRRDDSDQSLLVTTRIAHPEQLLPVVRYWLPHVRILQPQPWHEALVHSLQQALQRWGCSCDCGTATSAAPQAAGH